MAPTGEVEEVHWNERTATFKWKIPGSSQIGQGDHLSPSLTYFNMKWTITARNNKDGIHYVCIDRDLASTSFKESVHFSIKCNTSDGEEIVREQTISEGLWRGELYICPRWRIHSWDGLTLTCSLSKVDSPHTPGVSRETQTEEADIRNDDHPLEDISILREHFKKLLLSGDGHDVLIEVGDKQFKAHKHILKSRSPVFARMFSSDMAESAGNSVTIEDCDPDSFGQFLQFVYCGKADVASVGSALGLYYAGDKYDFPSLKKMCVEFLKSCFTTTTVFDVVGLAVRHEEEDLLQQAIVYFANNLEEVWRTMEWQRFHLANPNEANEMNLKALQCLKSSLYKK